MRRGQSLLFVLCLGLTPRYVGAERPYYPTIQEIVSQSEIVAVATIERVGPATIQTEQGSVSCGDVYRANIVESIKGQESAVRLLVWRGTKVPKASRYLLFLERFERERVERALDDDSPTRLPKEAKNHSRCAVRSAEYGIYAFPPGLIAFDDRASAELGGLWLDATYPSPAAWVEFEHATIVDGYDEHTVSSWRDVRKALVEATNAEKRD